MKTAQYVSVNGQQPRPMWGEIVEEVLACISVNGEEVATLMCTPVDLDRLALGFLYNEGVINGVDEVRAVHVARNDSCVDVWLHDSAYKLSGRPVITSGCGGGVTFDDLSRKQDALISELKAAPVQLAALMRSMHLGAGLYQRARGIHSAVIADQDRILLQVEDVGRHNCLDKLAGAALQEGVNTRDRILLSSGRISSEMINKARRLGTPIVCSRTSPTSLSVALAEEWQMTIVAYLRQDRMRIYSHPERILATETSTTQKTLEK